MREALTNAESAARAAHYALDSANRRERRTRIAFLVTVPAVAVGSWLVGLAW